MGVLGVGKASITLKHRAQFGAIYSSIGLAAIVTPSIVGIIADRWINAERLYGVLHILGAAALFTIPMVDSPKALLWVMLLNMCFYIPTISLAMPLLFGPEGRWQGHHRLLPADPRMGHVGFIVAMWTVSLLHLETTAGQFYVASSAALPLGLYSFTLPRCPPRYVGSSTSLVDMLGLRAFKLFKQGQMAVFFICALLLGAALQLTNA